MKLLNVTQVAWLFSTWRRPTFKRNQCYLVIHTTTTEVITRPGCSKRAMTSYLVFQSNIIASHSFGHQHENQVT